MKILHVNYSDIIGGASIAVNNIHKYLIKNKIDSKLLVFDKNTEDKNVIGPKNNFEKNFYKLREKTIKYITRRIFSNPSKTSYSLNLINTNILEKINKIQADIVHLHWVGNEMISINQLKKINKPIVWTFWDMWPINGAEHYSYNNRCIEGYNKTNRDNNEKGLDINRVVWETKLKSLNFKINIICPSTWLYDLTKKSLLYKESKVSLIPLSIDTNFWINEGKEVSKKNLGIELNKKVLLFSSTSGTNDRKGFDYILSSLNQMNTEKLILFIVGEKPKKLNELKIEYKYFGIIKDQFKQRIIYSATDLILMPSIKEVFGLVALEGASCSVPSVIFEGNGCSDLIEHKINGYISKYKNILDYKTGIEWCISDENKLNEMQKNSRIKAKDFDNELNFNKLIKYYKTIVNK